MPVAYQLTKPLVVFEPQKKHAFTIPTGSVVEKDDFLAAVGLIPILWAGKRVTVAVQDLKESSLPIIGSTA